MTRWEEKALEGEYGEALRIAMRVLVKVGEALGAERLIEISHAHVSGVSYFNIGDEGLEFLEDLVKLNAKVRVYTTANPASIAFSNIGTNVYPKEVVDKQMKIVNALIGMGVDPRSFTCIPYKLRRPKPGEHLAWAESSAVIYANSILGAKTNREGGPLALFAAIAGRTYYAGLHIDENRRPSIVIRFQGEVDSISMASALGLYIGNIASGVPYIEARIRIENEVLKDIAIRSMLASIASTSDIAMAYIQGVTRMSINGEELHQLERISIDIRDLGEYLEDMCSSILILGCPHLTLDEAYLVYRELRKSPLLRYVNRILIAIPRFDADSQLREELYREAKEQGIEIQILAGVCPVVSKLRPLVLDNIATIHGKARHYIPRLAGVDACLVSIV